MTHLYTWKNEKTIPRTTNDRYTCSYYLATARAPSSHSFISQRPSRVRKPYPARNKPCILRRNVLGRWWCAPGPGTTRWYPRLHGARRLTRWARLAVMTGFARASRARARASSLMLLQPPALIAFYLFLIRISLARSLNGGCALSLSLSAASGAPGERHEPRDMIHVTLCGVRVGTAWMKAYEAHTPRFCVFHLEEDWFLSSLWGAAGRNRKLWGVDGDF